MQAASINKQYRELAGYAKIPNFLAKKKGKAFDQKSKKKDKGLDQKWVMDQMADYLTEIDEPGQIRFDIIGKDGTRYWLLDLTKGGCKVSAGDKKIAGKKLRFIVVVREEVFYSIASGETSPISALANGALNISGDIDYGKQFYRLLAADSGKTDPCAA